jgi:polyhydroxyalkanoate synthesis regulator phasin
MGDYRPPHSDHPIGGPEHHEHPDPSEGSERVREVIRDGFTIMLGAASWAFEQGDRLVDTWLSQGKESRTEGRRRFDDFTERTRRAGEDFSRRVQDSVRTARSSMPLATREQVASLERQVADLTRQIESLKAGGGPPSTTVPPRDRSQMP